MVAVCAASIPASSIIVPPTVTTAINGVEMRSTVEEIAAVRISCIDAEVPITTIPIEWTIEICGVDKSAILPIEQYIAQIEIALCPIGTI